MAYLAAISFVGSILRPTKDTTSTPSMFFIPSRCLMPNAPAPASATLILPVTSIVLQDQVTHGRIAGRHMIKTVSNSGRLAAIHIVHGAARDQPHHQFDSLAPGLADVVYMRHEREALGVGDQPVKEVGIELLVDQPCARTLQLMAHSPSAPDLNVERLVVAFDCPADCLAKHVTSSSRGRGVLHDVDGKRDYRAWPRLWLAAHQAQRHSEAMVDIHLVDDG